MKSYRLAGETFKLGNKAYVVEKKIGCVECSFRKNLSCSRTATQEKITGPCNDPDYPIVFKEVCPVCGVSTLPNLYLKGHSGKKTKYQVIDFKYCPICGKEINK